MERASAGGWQMWLPPWLPPAPSPDGLVYILEDLEGILKEFIGILVPGKDSEGILKESIGIHRPSQPRTMDLHGDRGWGGRQIQETLPSLSGRPRIDQKALARA